MMGEARDERNAWREAFETGGAKVERLVMRYRCGWCGCPTDEKGNYIDCSDMTSDEIDREWGDAELTHGSCAYEQEMQRQQYEWEMRMEHYRDA